jgi:hypothetical protein
MKEGAQVTYATRRRVNSAGYERLQFSLLDSAPAAVTVATSSTASFLGRRMTFEGKARAHLGNSLQRSARRGILDLVNDCYRVFCPDD